MNSLKRGSSTVCVGERTTTSSSAAFGSGGKCPKTRSSACFDSGLPVTCPVEVRFPGRKTAAAAIARTIAPTQARMVGHGGPPQTRASRSVLPTAPMCHRGDGCGNSEGPLLGRGRVPTFGWWHSAEPASSSSDASRADRCRHSCGATRLDQRAHPGTWCGADVGVDDDHDDDTDDHDAGDGPGRAHADLGDGRKRRHHAHVGSATATALFRPYQAVPVGSSPEAVAIGDVTGDGRNDVVMTTSYNFDAANDFRLWVFAQAADGTLAPPVSYATAAVYTNRAQSIALGDITGDGRADVVLGIDGIGVQVFPQLATGLLGSPTMYSSPDTNKIHLGQLNGDGRLDVAGVGWGTNTVSVLLNDGQGGLKAPVSYPVQHAGYEDLEIGDVTGDGLDDLVVMSGQGLVPNVSVVPQLAAGGFGSAAPYTVAANTLTQGIGVGDVTGDGRNDVVASYGGNRPASNIAVFAQTAGGTLGAPTSYPSYDIPEPVDVADVDLDGRPDVVVLHGGWLKAGVYREQAGGTLGPQGL